MVLKVKKKINKNVATEQNIYAAMRRPFLNPRKRDRVLVEIHSEFETIPWFSSHEWKEVYENIFSSNAVNWKSAFNHIAVWKQRNSTLPIGIEASLPLLQARIALQDNAMEESSKISLLNFSIMKFVTIVTKPFEEKSKNGSKKSFNDIAQEILLPPHISNIRNVIVHNETNFGGIRTLEAFIDSSFAWIRTYYWEVEVELIEKKCSFYQPDKESEVSFKASDDISKSTNDVLLSNLKNYVGASVNVESIESFVTLLQEHGLSLDDEILSAIAEHLFCSEFVMTSVPPPQLTQAPILPMKIVTSFMTVIEHIGKANKLTCFIRHLFFVSKNKTLTKKCFAWIYFFAISSVRDYRLFQKKKLSTAADLKFSSFTENFHQLIDWNLILFSMMETEEKNDINFVGELLKLYLIDKKKTDILLELGTAYLGNKSGDLQQTPYKRKLSQGDCAGKMKKMVRTEEKETESIKTVNDILHASSQLPEKVLRQINELALTATNKGTIIGEGVVMKMGTTSLGVLPHQVGDPDFYKKLILGTNKDTNEHMKCS